MRFATAAAALALLLVSASCAAGTGGPTTQPDGLTPTADGSAPTPSLSPSAAPSESREGDMLTGELGTIDVEGGCAYLEAEDGFRYEVMYPRGWTMNAIAGNLVDPEGQVVATAGDRVTVRGHLAGEMVSICQIGPIFQASEVVSVEPR